MVNHFRRLVQEQLSSIPDLECGEIIGDDMIEEGSYYFGYRVSTAGQRYNLDYSDRRDLISITGYLSTKGGSLSKFDDFTDEILSKLANLRITATATDITTLDTKIRRCAINGSVLYNSLDRSIKVEKTEERRSKLGDFKI